MADQELFGQFADDEDETEDTTRGGIHPVSKSEARTYVEGSQLDWDDLEDKVTGYESWLGSTMRYALSLSGLDAIAIEFSVSGGGGAVIGGEAATGVSVLFPLWSEYEPEPDEKHPIEDAPHWYLFTSVGVDVGGTLGGSAGVDAQVVFADHWGGAEHISRQSWGGGVVSVDVEGTAALGAGAQLDVTAYFTSATDFEKPEYGILTWDVPDRGWHGAGVGAGLATGAQIELSGGVTITSACEDIIDFGNPAVRKAMRQSGEDIPELDHYRRPDKGPGFIHALIEGLSDL
ncbi:hypothetical protein ACOZ4N_10855 [Halorientalis pallida]|uniref:hypothetical protein n=1 Tax=Halorientalis pallida TaxID=2479928 RepID=UPI003C6F008B